MKNLRLILAAIICVSLMAFTGCGNSDTSNGNANDTMDNGTVTEETTDNRDSFGEDVVDETEKAADDVKDGVDNAVDNGTNNDTTKNNQ